MEPALIDHRILQHLSTVPPVVIVEETAVKNDLNAFVFQSATIVFQPSYAKFPLSDSTRMGVVDWLFIRGWYIKPDEQSIVRDDIRHRSWTFTTQSYINCKDSIESDIRRRLK